jgi:hypothetical protein
VWGRFGDDVVRILYPSVAAIISDYIYLRAHTGASQRGLDFSEAHSGWKTHIEEPFISHLNNVFSASPLFFYVYIINSHPAGETRQAFALPGTDSMQLGSVPSTTARGDASKTISVESLDSLIKMDENPSGSEDDPEQETHDHGQEGRNREQDNPEQDDPEHPEQDDPEQDDLEQDDSEQDDPEQDDPEQDDPEQDDPEQEDSERVDLLSESERGDWPRWLKDAIDHLLIVSTADIWSTLLSSYVKLERKLGFAGAVSKLFRCLSKAY